MGAIAVVANGVGKKYLIGEREQYLALRDVIATRSQMVLDRLSGRRGIQEDSAHSWALRDVSFEVERGEVLGVIGRNGAGKSTLLKILSRITHPTEGHTVTYGRIGSLLEVGSGFHPELTGRENIYLNGAILGMLKGEIDRKFDEIVAFSEIEAYLDTPVKRYSSGMYMRLAFSVAAHLEPEILIVDEVLAVGDSRFQQKCLGRMRELSGGMGRTVLFVSHNMEAIKQLCTRSILLEEGRIVDEGESAHVVDRYMAEQAFRSQAGQWISIGEEAHAGTGEARFVALRYGSDESTHMSQPYTDGPLEVMLQIESDSEREVGSLAVFLTTVYGTKLINADTVRINQPVMLRPGRNLVRLRIERLHLNPGRYRLGLWLANPVHAQRRSRSAYDSVEFACEVEVASDPAGGSFDQASFVPCEFTVETLE